LNTNVLICRYSIGIVPEKNIMNELKIFLVDDDSFYLNVLKQHLLNLGCEKLSLYENGVDCLDELTNKVDVIFLDYEMASMTGNEVLLQIKRLDPNIFIIMLSSQEEIQIAVNALKLGAFDYLKKGDNEPARIENVLERIMQVKELMERERPSLLKAFFKYL
jgi:DNA-binding NtrC family response regulator